uniref:Si:ch211-213d14.1 n=1 Tax=Scophthalmus maximus TaxID=52904 RepID=A0A8D3CEC2_SCOMX
MNTHLWGWLKIWTELCCVFFSSFPDVFSQTFSPSLQTIRSGCTKASESSIRSKTCWQRSDPGRQVGPDTVEDRPLRLHTSRCQVRLNTNTPLIFVIHHWISLDHKSANTVSIGSTIVRILTRECEVVMTKMTLGFVWSPAGSHMLPSYYGMRRPFISDSDFASVKQFSPDVYSSALGGKPLGCDPSTMTSYSSLIDSYYPEAFGDYRSAATFSSSGGSFLPSSALSSLLPPFSGESSHLFPRDSWDQSVPEPVSQVEALCPDSLASVSVPPSMPSPEPPGSPSQYRSNSRGSSMCSVPGSQPYTLHSLEDAHYHSLTGSSSYPAAPSSSFSCTPYMSSSASDLVSKMVTEEDGSLPANGEASWAKEDGVSPWSPYEIRRPY